MKKYSYVKKSKIIKSLLIYFLCLIVLFFLTSCKAKLYNVCIDDEVYNKYFYYDSEIIYGKKYEINLIPKSSYDTLNSKQKSKSVLGFIENFETDCDYVQEIKQFLHKNESHVSENLKTENTCGFIYEKTFLYPCVPFEENLPALITQYQIMSDDSLPLNFYKLEDIPQGYVAIPFSFEKQDYEWKGINAVYPDNPIYPFFTNKYLNLTLTDEDNKKICKYQSEIKQWFENDLYKEVKKETYIPNIVFSSATGDIMIARGVEDKLIKSGSPDEVFKNTLKVLQNNDITIGNLEGVVTTKSDKAIKTYTFKFKKAALKQLKQAGYDYFMLTNNHSYDFGEAGFKDTLAALKEYDFKTSGAGYNIDQAKQIYTKNINNTRISILSVGAYPVEQSGFNGEKTASATDKRAGILWKSDEVFEIVKNAKAISDFVIVNVHAGSEYVTTPTQIQRDFYTKLCDSGADVIFGSHPHVLQPVEWYNDSLIVWSLGNFVFPGMEEMKGAEDTMIIRIGIVDGRLLYYQKYPAKINGKTVDLVK